jgi:hypothetical protein
MTQTLHRNIDGLQILTDSGWEDFAGVLKKNLRPTVKVVTQTKTIECTADHEFFDYKFRKITASKLKPRDKLLSSVGIEMVVSVSATKVQRVYDILNAGQNHRFYANDLLVSNCEFILDSETLVDSLTLAALAPQDPTSKMGQVRWFKQPQKHNTYVVSLDPAAGTGGDYAAIQILDASTLTQIGEWRHNKTPIPEQVKLLADITEYIVDITNQPELTYYGFENNGVGEAVRVSLSEMTLDNIRGNFISEPKKLGAGNRLPFAGFVTSKTSKNAACSKFKSLLESRRMTIYSQPLISELKTYVAHGGSYAAVSGQTDDLVASMLIAVRMIGVIQTFDSKISKQYVDHNEIKVPMPFIMSMGY